MNKSGYSIYHLLLYFFQKNEPVQKVKAGTVLFQEKDPVQYVYLLLQGNVALGRVHYRGKEFILKILGNQEFIMEYQLFKRNPRYQFGAKAMTDCQLLMIKKDEFEKFALTDPDAMSSLAAWLSTRYLKAQMKCEDLIMNGKKGGLYSMLIRLCNSYGRTHKDGILINLPLTHQELANLTFGTREVVHRLLKELREKEVIAYENSYIIVKNIDYLQNEVDCQNCPCEICGIN